MSKANGNCKGKLVWIDKDELVIPAKGEEGVLGLKEKELFQRKCWSKYETEKRAREWSWPLCGALIVRVIKKQKMVLDGGNRTRSARLNPDIVKLPCVLFPETSVQEGAKHYYDANCKRRNLSSLAKHVANLAAKDSLAIQTQQIIEDGGYTTERNIPYSFDAIAALYNIVRIDDIVAAEAFSICAEICNGERIYKEFLYGVFEIERRSRLQGRPNVFSKVNLDKLVKEGVPRIMQNINSKRALYGKSGGGQSKIIPAIAILELVNKGRRSGKVKVDFGL